MLKIKIIFIVLFLINSFLGIAQDGSLDSSFGINGRTQVDVSETNSTGDELAYAVATNSSGYIFIVGQTNVNNVTTPTVLKLEPNGTLDSSFGNSGVLFKDLGVDSTFDDINILQDDSMLISGVLNPFSIPSMRNPMIAKLLSDGSIDTSFGTNGLLSPFPDDNALFIWTISNNETIYTAGTISDTNNTHFALRRFLSNGAIDTSFGTNGIVSFDIEGVPFESNAIAISNDNKILLNGVLTNNGMSSNVLIRLNPDGSLDSSFGTNGIVSIALNSEYRCQIEVYENDHLAVLYSRYDINFEFVDNQIMRFNTDGVLDLSFGNNGILIPSPTITNLASTEIIIQDNQRLLLFGEITNFMEGGGAPYLNRYLLDGTEDPSFNHSGNDIDYYASDFMLQEDGKILCLGTTPWYTGIEDMVIERYNNTTLSVENFNYKTLKLYPNPTSGSFTIESSIVLNYLPYDVIDLTGKVISSGQLNGFTTDIGLSSLPNGIYFLKVLDASYRVLINN